jgi:hypothetical protein
MKRGMPRVLPHQFTEIHTEVEPTLLRSPAAVHESYNRYRRQLTDPGQREQLPANISAPAFGERMPRVSENVRSILIRLRTP